MRLLRTSNFTITSFSTGEAPTYAILSHRWENDELTYQDTESGVFRSKKSFRKVREACRIAEKHGCEWLWIDTCCINKQDLVELSEAINAMYRYYKEAEFCIAYLFDHTDGIDKFEKSSWFTRCWTLQELIAPRKVVFYDSEWTCIGSKASRDSEIADITGIPKFVLRGGSPHDCSVAQRMSWASCRKATRVEDEAYSLLGLFGLTLQPLYGTGSQAFQELQQRLLQKHDQSVLAWDRALVSKNSEYTGLMADSPMAFKSCRSTEAREAPIGSMHLVGEAVELEALTIPYTMGIYICILECTSTASNRQDAIYLQQLDAPDQYARIIMNNSSVTSISRKRIKNDATCKRRKLYIYHELRHGPSRIMPGFYIPRIGLLKKYRSRHDQDHIRILSRLDGPVDMNSDGTLVQLPRDQMGTVGQIYFEKDKRNFREWPIDGIKFGFDSDFNPVVRIGTGTKAMGRLQAWTRSAPEPGTEEFHRVWSDSWIYEKLEMRMKDDKKSRGKDQYEIVKREYTPEEYFSERGFEQMTAGRTRGQTVDRHDLGVKVSLKLCDFVDAKRPVRKGEHPWKIWTLNISEERDFATERHDLHTMYAVGATAIAASLVFHHFHKSH